MLWNSHVVRFGSDSHLETWKQEMEIYMKCVHASG